MRLALRALLLAAGCLVMVATSPTRQPFYAGMRISTGEAQVVSFPEVRSTDGKTRVQPLLHVRSYRETDTPGVVRLVGILAPEGAHYTGRPQLDPKASFTVGQWVEEAGTVVFVQEVSIDPGFHAMQPDPLPLPQQKGYALTLFSPDAYLNVELELDARRMAEQCQCEVRDTYLDSVFVHDASPPDAGTGGRDGG